jgi:phosphinothricin acetyltransferase
METIRIRRARETDLAEINEIYNESVRSSVFAFDVHQRTDEARRAWFATHVPPYAVFVAEVDGTVAGWASISPWAPHDAYTTTGEHSLFVGARYRGAGIGKALLGVVIEEAERAGFHVLIGRITAGNVVSHALHRGFGFEEIGTMREVGWKFGRWLDVCLVQRILSADNPPGTDMAGV